jgi:hypothetical protein
MRGGERNTGWRVINLDTKFVTRNDTCLHTGLRLCAQSGEGSVEPSKMLSIATLLIHLEMLNRVHK